MIELLLVAFLLPEIKHLNLVCFGFVIATICLACYGAYAIVEKSNIDSVIVSKLSLASIFMFLASTFFFKVQMVASSTRSMLRGFFCCCRIRDFRHSRIL